MRKPIVALAALLLSSPTFAQDARLLPFTGEWHGVGEAREGVNAPWESASCEITIEWQRGLRSNGVCEGARGRFSAGGTIEVNGNTLTGSFMAPHFVDMAQAPTVELVNGALVSRYVFERDGASFQFALTVRRVGNQLAMQTEMLIDGRYQEVGHLTLTAD